MNKKKITLLLITFFTIVFAQQDEQSALYNFNMLNFNPAYTGSRQTINITAIGRFQWAGASGAPMTQFLSIHSPVYKQDVNIGLNVVNDKIGARNRTSIYGNFAYAFRLNRKNDRFAIGASAGVDLVNNDFNQLVIDDPTDPSVQGSYFKVVGNFGVGLMYYGKKHFVGFGIPRLMENDLNNPNVIGNARTARHFYISGGYVFTINDVTKLKPSALIKITPNAPLTFDLNGTFILFDKIFAGLGWRFSESVGLNFAYKFKDLCTLGYAFEYPYNDLRLNQYGTHEIMLQFDIKRSKKHENAKFNSYY